MCQGIKEIELPSSPGLTSLPDLPEQRMHVEETEAVFYLRCQWLTGFDCVTGPFIPSAGEQELDLPTAWGTCRKMGLFSVSPQSECRHGLSAQLIHILRVKMFLRETVPKTLRSLDFNAEAHLVKQR